ncbi:MAG: 1-aminocyclopropane-1-carboxylate deaminase/D-cysteine desulfhydrase [Sulfurovum sp.]
MVFTSSPIDSIEFENHSLFLKRDDLLHIDFSGNKARKFYYYLHNDFPHIKKIISYGSAQSNAMYSLSVLAKLKGWEFEYFIEHIASYVVDNPHGNYRGALENGMKIHISKPPTSYPSDTLFIEEGGRGEESEFGIKILAQEIEQWQKENKIKELNVFLPSGTGTTALFLQKNLPSNIVYTTPCVGDKNYLIEQFRILDSDTTHHPTVVTLPKKHHFGKLYLENYKIWLKLQLQTEVEFDLLYDPLGWRVLLSSLDVLSKPTLYIHQGGILGNESMLPRYERKYKELANEDIL